MGGEQGRREREKGWGNMGMWMWEGKVGDGVKESRVKTKEIRWLGGVGATPSTWSIGS